MKIGDLKNISIIEHREQVKIEAMKAVRQKAIYLLESIDEKVGKVISVSELDDNFGYFWRAQNLASNTIMLSNTNEYDTDNMK